MSGCGVNARLSIADTSGPTPTLPAPQVESIPTLAPARAVHWPAGKSPEAAPGLRVTRFADGLVHPRALLMLPNGDVLVAEANTPSQPGKTGLMDWLERLVQRFAGAGTPSPDRISILRDTDGDGRADLRAVFATGLRSPFGMVYDAPWLYVACTDAIVRIRHASGEMRAAGPPERVAELPAGPINYHWTRSLAADLGGRRLFVGVGSNSNIGERGLQLESGRAAIWEVGLPDGRLRSFATGLRNPTALAWDKQTATLWAAVAERDALGGDLVPDYLSRIVDGGFYGWPYSYFGARVDPRVRPQRPDLVASALVPDYALGAHTTPIGLALADHPVLGLGSPGFFVSRHGSWNRRPRSGYDVVFVPVAEGRPSGLPQTILAGFLSRSGRAYGRPAGLALDPRGALLVADDAGDVIWRVTSSAYAAAPHR